MSSDSFHEEAFVMDGLSASILTDEYVTETLPGAGVDAIQKTVAGTRDNFRTATDSIAELYADVERWPNVHQARNVADIREQDGLSIVFGFQGTAPLEDDPENVRIFDELDVKIIQLTYNSRNLSGNGCTERVDGGISNFGLEVIDAIERHDIVLDLSHVGPQTALDALDAATQPTVFSHSNPSAVHDHPRNISDEHIKAAVETGGTVGVNSFPAFVGEDPTVDDLVDHVEYLAELVGAENITLGLDFIDNRNYEDLTNLVKDPEYPDPPCNYPAGLESAAEMPNLTAALDERGFTAEEIRGIMGGNLLRLYESVWGN